jgi:hypothetical protein
VKFDLTSNEQVLHPNPFVPEEYNPVVVTTKRLLYAPHGAKTKEMPADKITYAGKGFHQTFIKVMVIMVLVGAPLFIIGALRYYSYKDAPTEPPAKVKGMAQKPVTQQDMDTYANNKTQKTVGIVLAIFGAAFGGVAYLLYKRRHVAVVAVGKKALQIPVKDKATQDKLLMMIGAAQQSSKAMMPMPIPDKVQKLGPPPPKLSK